MREPTCPECSVTMERGFVLDRAHQSRGAPAQWVSGEPERSFWLGLKLGGRKRITMSVYRCPRCGRLQSFAPDA